MIPYSRDPQQMIPTSAVKIIGLGGAGANMLERIALEGMEGAELLALNTDVRTLTSSLALEKIQLGVNLTKGLGAGGDPELGHQAVLESEDQIRLAIQGRRIVFLCTGLGGGTGSGAAPIVTRIAREEGAFVVVFATMPFAFEGRRRREQAETALNELAVLSNALVTFDNNRMGELVLAKQGIHEAFAAADHMICESIKAVIRLVVRPGLINVGLDDLMSALRTNRSRCLFGSGLAAGKDRAAKALKNALSSPLLDQGALLKEAQTVLVHLSGGEDLTLFEIELLMQRLQKFVPEKAHVLFGAAIDPAMGDSLSITLISALPEDSLAAAPRDSINQGSQDPSLLDPSQGFTAAPMPKIAPPVAEMVAESEEDRGFADPDPAEPPSLPSTPSGAVLFSPLSKFRRATTHATTDDEAPFAEEVNGFHENLPSADSAEPATEHEPEEDIENELDISLGKITDTEPHLANFAPGPKNRPPLTTLWGKSTTAVFPEDMPDESEEEAADTELKNDEMPKLKLGIKTTGPQSELSLDSAPRGRFEGETPNVLDGEDLDLPPFLRKKK